MQIQCPTCHRTVEGVRDDFPHRPFCSSRCKTIDLGNWLDESYRISTPLGDHPGLPELLEGDEAPRTSDDEARLAAELLRRLRSGG